MDMRGKKSSCQRDQQPREKKANMKKVMAESCALPLTEKSFLVINDQDDYEYNVETDDWTSHHDLHTNKDSYACGIVNDKLCWRLH